MKNENNNPYPQGRWTSNPVVTPAASENQRISRYARPAAELIGPPLRELFWGLPESSLLQDARDRVERVLDAALARPVQGKLSFA
jgi:hypothetical protein